MALRPCAFILVGVLPSSHLRAEEEPASPGTLAIASTELRLPSNTEVHLHIIESVGSNTYKRGQHFGIETAEPVLVDGVELIGKGVKGEGEVIHADKASLGGRAGELILAARFLRVGDIEVKLKSFTIAVGHDRLDLATGVGAAIGLPGLFIKGKNIVIPAGSDVSAKVATDVLLPLLQSDSQHINSVDVHSAEIIREYKKDDTSKQ
jgi:hypothetical protein